MKKLKTIFNYLRKIILAKKIIQNKFIILNLPFSEVEKFEYSFLLENHFKYAFSNKSKKGFETLENRKDLGSILINTNHEIEILLKKVLQKSLIIDIAKKIWSCKNIYYASTFSHYRYVDPFNQFQKGYSNLHQDFSFLKSKSLNICIPASGYGGPFPGIEFIQKINYLPKEISQYNKLFKEPKVLLGQALIFNELIVHRRSNINKSKLRINTEFRLFPDYVLSEKEIEYGLKLLI